MDTQPLQTYKRLGAILHGRVEVPSFVLGLLAAIALLVFASACGYWEQDQANITDTTFVAHNDDELTQVVTDLIASIQDQDLRSFEKLTSLPSGVAASDVLAFQHWCKAPNGVTILEVKAGVTPSLRNITVDAESGQFELVAIAEEDGWNIMVPVDECLIESQ